MHNAIRCVIAKSYRLPCGGSHNYRGTCSAFEEDANGGRYLINYDEIDMESNVVHLIKFESAHLTL